MNQAFIYSIIALFLSFSSLADQKVKLKKHHYKQGLSNSEDAYSRLLLGIGKLKLTNYTPENITGVGVGSKVNLTRAYSIGVGGGIKLFDFTDLEFLINGFAYARNSNLSVTKNSQTAIYNVRYSAIYPTVNLIFHASVGKFTPFFSAGGGWGVINARFSPTAVDTMIRSKRVNSVIYNFGFGAAYEYSDSLSVDLSYRYNMVAKNIRPYLNEQYLFYKSPRFFTVDLGFKFRSN